MLVDEHVNVSMWCVLFGAFQVRILLQVFLTSVITPKDNVCFDSGPAGGERIEPKP